MFTEEFKFFKGQMSTFIPEEWHVWNLSHFQSFPVWAVFIQTWPTEGKLVQNIIQVTNIIWTEPQKVI